MPGLTLPTGAEIAGLFTGSPGSVPAFGMWTAVTIDHEIATLVRTSVAWTETERMKYDISLSGLDPLDLTQDQFDKARLALLWACVYSYKIKERTIKQSKGAACEDWEDFKGQMKMIKESICGFLKQINAGSEFFCGYAPTKQIDNIKEGEKVDYSVSVNFN